MSTAYTTAISCGAGAVYQPVAETSQLHISNRSGDDIRGRKAALKDAPAGLESPTDLEGRTGYDERVTGVSFAVWRAQWPLVIAPLDVGALDMLPLVMLPWA